MADDLGSVFDELRERMLRSSTGMDVAQDQPGNVVLRTAWIEQGKKEHA